MNCGTRYIENDPADLKILENLTVLCGEIKQRAKLQIDEKSNLTETLLANLLVNLRAHYHVSPFSPFNESPSYRMIVKLRITIEISPTDCNSSFFHIFRLSS